MKLTIKDEREKTARKVNFPKSTLHELLTQLNINPETVIVVRKEEVITEKEKLRDNDHLEILSVISGG